jgi:hypothetical protein
MDRRLAGFEFTLEPCIFLLDVIAVIFELGSSAELLMIVIGVIGELRLKANIGLDRLVEFF